jgi:hypothetical protein
MVCDFTKRRRGFVLVAVAIALAVPVAVGAHGGHVHTIKGTVTASDAAQVSIKQTDGKTVVVKLNEKTVFLKGEKKADRAALAVGQRVIADVGDGKEPLVAKSIKLGVVDSKESSNSKSQTPNQRTAN